MAGIVPTKVNVLFDPDEKSKPVKMDVETGSGTRFGKSGLVRECSYHDIRFAYFEGTIKEGVTLMAVPMILPGFFDQIGTDKDVRRLFLLRTGVTEAGTDKNKLTAFFKDTLWNGTQGCPIGILVYPDDTRKKSHNYFTFNGMRFYPFLMREFTVGYFVCDENAKKCHWPKFHPKDPGIGLDYPLMYDATLGLFVTRGAHYVSYEP